MAPKPKYTKDEKVLCYHHDFLYEAKILDIDTEGKEVKYIVHYQGWSKKWDDFVNEDRILKLNEQGLQKQKEMNKAAARPGGATSKKKAPKSKTPAAESKPEAKTDKDSSRSSTPTTAEPPSTKHKLDEKPSEGSRSRKKQKVAAEPAPVEKAEEEPAPRVTINIKFPENLKLRLVDDYDCINRQHMIVCLPAEKTVDAILNDYHIYRSTKDKNCGDTILEITKGFRDYFNASLGTQLLYKVERAQYDEILRQDDKVELCAVYGIIHFLRLFSRIGSMMEYVDAEMGDREQSIIITHVHDFLNWMSRNETILFTKGLYYTAPTDYLRKAML